MGSTVCPYQPITPDLSAFWVDSWTDSLYPLWHNGFRRPPLPFSGWTTLDRLDGFAPFGAPQLYTPAWRFTP